MENMCRRREGLRAATQPCNTDEPPGAVCQRPTMCCLRVTGSLRAGSRRTVNPDVLTEMSQWDDDGGTGREMVTAMPQPAGARAGP
jgi:hypothetical protein